MRDFDQHGRKHQKGLGAVMLVIALLLPLWLVPSFARIPDNFKVRKNLQGEVTLFQLIPVDQNSFPIDMEVEVEAFGGHDEQLKIRETTKFNTVLHDQLLLIKALQVLFEYASVRSDYLEKMNLFFGISTEERTFWVDARQGTYVSPEAANGSQWIFPIGKARKRDYRWFEAISGTSFEFKFAREDKVSGRNVYVYEADLGQYDLGSIDIPSFNERVRLDARGKMSVALDKNTSYPVEIRADLDLYAQAGLVSVDVLTVNLREADEQIRNNASAARHAGILLNLGNFIAPLLFAGVGLYLCLYRPRKKNNFRIK